MTKMLQIRHAQTCTLHTLSYHNCKAHNVTFLSKKNASKDDEYISFTLNSESHSSTTPRSEPSIFLSDHPLAAPWTERDRGQSKRGGRDTVTKKESSDCEREGDMKHGGKVEERKVNS